MNLAFRTIIPGSEFVWGCFGGGCVDAAAEEVEG